MKTLWIALLEVKAIDESSIPPECKGMEGAITNGVVEAPNRAAAETLFREQLKQEGFELVKVTDIETYRRRCKNWQITESIRSTAHRARRHGTTEFDAFYWWEPETAEGQK